MAKRDSEREWERLAQRYRAMSDGELSKLAAESQTLTEEARLALRAEVARRNLRLVAETSRDDVQAGRGPSGPIVIRRYFWLHEALLAKTILDSSDIECTLADEHTIRMNWFWTLALGEVKVWVRAEDADAIELLDQGWIESFMVAGVGEYIQPRCPNCQSFEISYKGLLKRLAYFSLLGWWLTSIVPPLAFHDLGWRCHACGHLWQEDAETAETAR
jgi:hypothetical protein